MSLLNVVFCFAQTILGLPAVPCPPRIRYSSPALNSRVGWFSDGAVVDVAFVVVFVVEGVVV